MNDTILKKVITISSIEDKEKLLKIKDQDGKTFNVFKTKQDGQPTQAYNILFGLPGYGMGKTVEASYKESPYTMPDGKQITTRSIIGFKPVGAPRPDMTPPTPNIAPKPLQSQNIDKKQPSSEPNWDEIARGKVRHGVAIAFIEKNSQLSQETANAIDAWTDYIMTGKFGKDLAKEQREEFGGQFDEPPMPDNEEINLENIPF